MDENYKLAKWLSGEMSKEELSAFEAEPDYAIFEKIKNHSSQLEAPSFNEQKSLTRILASPKKKVKTILLTQQWRYKIAAVLVIGLGIFFAFSNFIISSEIAKNGNKKAFVLPDNSEVILNSGSRIQYKKWNWDNNRTLELDGEAYFKVAKGNFFEVNTALGKVTVLGTQFNVKQRQNRFEVTCYEGKVRVNYNEKEIIITKNRSIAFENGKPIVLPKSTVQSPEWMNNEMVFYQANLKSIIAEFERHFNVTLDLKSNDNSQLFTGTIPSENIDIALQILSTSYHLKPTKVSKNEFILESLNAQ